MIHSYIETMPEFRMEKDATISEASCKEFYEFLSHMYQLFCEQPNLLFPTIYEDGSYTNRFNKSSDENPTLIMEMKNDIKVIEDFLVSLFLIGIESQLEDNRLIVARNHRILPKHKEILPLLGLQFEDRVLSSEIYPQIFSCWKWMATRKGASVFRFSRAMFDMITLMQVIYLQVFWVRREPSKSLSHILPVMDIRGWSIMGHVTTLVM